MSWEVGVVRELVSTIERNLVSPYDNQYDDERQSNLWWIFRCRNKNNSHVGYLFDPLWSVDMSAWSELCQWAAQLQ